MVIQCFSCGNTYNVQYDGTSCESCGGLLEVQHNFSGLDADLLKRTFAERLSERMSKYASGVWRYKELVHPALSEQDIVTRGEGNTGLYDVQAVSAFTGSRKVWLKAQSENPSSSFKDNGMTVAVSVGRSLGYHHFACSSTGNTSSSLAMYAAWCGAKAQVHIPNKDVSPSKILQTLAYGAELVRFEGTYDDALRYLEKEGRAQGLYVCNSINPWRIEGQKTMVYEIAQSLGWKLPDWIVVPGGALSNVTSIGKALRDLKEIGLIERLPRIALVHAELRPSIATALNIVHPPSLPKAELVLAQFAGVRVSVSEQEIIAAKAIIDRSGIGCEPASAASAAGLKKLVATGAIDKDESAVCILTGHLLKDTEALQVVHGVK